MWQNLVPICILFLQTFIFNKKKARKSLPPLSSKTYGKSIYVLIFIFLTVSIFFQCKSYIWLQLLFIDRIDLWSFTWSKSFQLENCSFYSQHCTKLSFTFMFVPWLYSIMWWLSFEKASTHSICEILLLTGKVVTFFCFWPL